MITLRSSVMLVAFLVAALEIIFCTVSLFGHFRPFTTFDAQFLFMVALVATATEKWTPRHFDLSAEFQKLPGVYKFYFGMAVYVLLLKTTYFLGFFARVLFDLM